ncbi:MAG TPA: hypothetical protein VGK96_00970 [Candidatus Sulfotelmatobacter sp.]|jgi:phosphotransferase system  glucose/maltose/N-acetylglucosamine-specific IIC component
MSKSTARNALIVIGMWAVARNIALLLNALIAVIHSRGMTFTGDAGIVMMWLSEGIADDLVAALAVITLVWVIETRKPSVSIGGLAALYLYSGAMNAWRILRRWHELRTSDYIGILMQAILPALVCLVVGLWWRRYSSSPRVEAA